MKHRKEVHQKFEYWVLNKWFLIKIQDESSKI